MIPPYTVPMQQQGMMGFHNAHPEEIGQQYKSHIMPEDEIPMEEYVAVNVPQSVADLLAKYDIAEPQSDEEAIEGLSYIITEYGENAVIDILNIHPDKDVILDKTSLSKDNLGKMLDKYWRKLPTLAKAGITFFAIWGAYRFLQGGFAGGSPAPAPVV